MARYGFDGVIEYPPRGPCRVFDADGVEYHKVVACDEKTGEVVKLRFDSRGKFVLSPNGEEAQRETVFVKPPLRFAPVGNRNQTDG